MTRTLRGLFLLVGLFLFGLTCILFSPLLFAGDTFLEVSLVPKPESGESEYIVLYQDGSENVDISSWYITDELSSPSVVFTFPSATELTPNTPLQVCQGTLSATPVLPCQFHFGGSAKWNNGGDTLRLYDHEDNEIMVLTYTDTVTIGEVVKQSVVIGTSEDGSDGEQEESDADEEVGDDTEQDNESGEDDTNEDGNSSEDNPPSDETGDEEGAENDDSEPGSETEDNVDNDENGDEEASDSSGDDTVVICKATNNHRRPFREVRVPVRAVIGGYGISDADIVPTFQQNIGRNIRERYQVSEGTLSGAQILYKRCEVSRPQPYRAQSKNRWRSR